MQTVMIVGAGKVGLAILHMIKDLKELDIKVAIDVNRGSSWNRMGMDE